ncbi:MAG TPA: UvrB/UvrC motif-containing protein [Gemmataceae bacterium]|nr:UvrB/UvrC motif-containing protein [Gemmataceae bacterium]
MGCLFQSDAFQGFGPNALDRSEQPPDLVCVSGKRSTALRQRVRKECPRHAGVYGMLSDRDELIYVGKAKCLRSRLLSYFRRHSRDPKAGRILRHTRAIVWEPASSEFAALLRELELIRRWRPRFNVQGQPGRRRPAYVCVGRKPAPYIFLSRFPAKDTACFGPVSASWRAREAVRRLNDVFQLRDCPQAQTLLFAEQAELFPVTRTPGCLRYEIHTCLGPCVGACARRDYMSQVRAAQAFLRGDDMALLETMEREMTAASEALAFERAGGLRDKLEAIRWLHERLERLRTARDKQSFVYQVQGDDGGEMWYVIHGGRVVAVFPRPQSRAERRTLAQAIRKTFNKPLENDPVTSEQFDGVLLVAAWFRRHPDEKKRMLSPQAAMRALKGVEPSLRHSG